MDSRRTFIKKASLLAGGAGLLNTLPPAVQRAFAIDPVAGSTYLDAEHVVILMQENRSFDHCYGTLQGVRGFNDPRVITKPDGNAVWVQQNAQGESYTPFRLNLRETKSTWIGSLPHSWTDQVDARNNGRYDQWLIAKASGREGFAAAPLTMGYYNREDIPFYHSLADAFTVCDQNFCSALTGTTPNRLYLWTGTIREEKNANVHANVLNSDINYEAEASWTTFPERLEDHNISWKIYQNEVSLPTGLTGEEESWLANFTDNSIEWFKQYNIRFSKGYRDYLTAMKHTLPADISRLTQEVAADTIQPEERVKKQTELGNKTAQLKNVQKELDLWSKEAFERLTDRQKNLHKKAFSVNSEDPNYHSLETVTYEDDGVNRKMSVPKGDVLFQFRDDVNKGNLPAVSWIVAPEKFSDHPGAPWYGAWYVSEVMDILTNNPAVWQKTIFILCYDENDGYFDHVPPFVPPVPGKKDTGLVSAGIDTSVDYVTLEQDMKRKDKEDARESPIGLGYRVPLVIASPWSRGGAVCSEVFDHTSIVRFLEKLFSHKTNKKIVESNISDWRRVVCGDLSSVFQPYNNEKMKLPGFVDRESFLKGVHKAQFKKDPGGYKPLAAEEIARVNDRTAPASVMPQQEVGTRPACPLPYELYVHGGLVKKDASLKISFSAGKEVFGSDSAGSPFIVYASGKPQKDASGKTVLNELFSVRNYAVKAGDSISDMWNLTDLNNRQYYVQVFGPNGFYRAFAGDSNDPPIEIFCEYERHKKHKNKLTGNLRLRLVSRGAGSPTTVTLRDNSYKSAGRTIKLNPGADTFINVDLQKQSGWYDFTLAVPGNKTFSQQFAGHVETGTMSRTDPAMGGVI